MSSWGARRLTWTAQREHVAQIVKVVKAHKGASVFMSLAAILNPTHQSYDAMHNTLPQYSAAICNHTRAVSQEFDRAGFDRAGGVIEMGPAG